MHIWFIRIFYWKYITNIVLVKLQFVFERDAMQRKMRKTFVSNILNMRYDVRQFNQGYYKLRTVSKTIVIPFDYVLRLYIVFQTKNNLVVIFMKAKIKRFFFLHHPSFIESLAISSIKEQLEKIKLTTPCWTNLAPKRTID